MESFADYKLFVKERILKVQLSDIGVIFASLLLIYCFRASDVFEFVPAWKFDLEFSDQSKWLPVPIVTDLNSDNLNELLILDCQFNLSILSFFPSEGKQLSHPFFRNTISVSQKFSNTSQFLIDVGFINLHSTKNVTRKQVRI